MAKNNHSRSLSHTQLFTPRVRPLSLAEKRELRRRILRAIKEQQVPS